ncbi:hypothetical protein EOM82_03040 [bacterium]|nr:hypothetical protein [bacterium]
MRKKLFNSLVILSLAILAAIIILVVFDIINPALLWVKYIIMLALIVLGLSLNLSFRRQTDFDEAESCLKRARKSIERLNLSNRAAAFVKLLSINNQLSNAITYLEDIIASHDLYLLRYDLGKITEIKNHYAISGETYVLPNEAEIKEDAEIIKRTIETVKNYKQARNK